MYPVFFFFFYCKEIKRHSFLKYDISFCVVQISGRFVLNTPPPATLILTLYNLPIAMPQPNDWHY